MVNEQLHAIYRGFRRDAHPMAVMCGVVGALAAFYHEGLDIFDPHHRMIASHRLVAKMPTIAAMVYKYSFGQPFVYPRNDLGYAENLLNMLFSVPCEPYRVPTAAARALEALLIIQADHEQNASTSQCGSSARPGRTLCLHRSGESRPVGAAACGGQRGVCCRPWPRSARSTAFPRSCGAPRTRTTPIA